VTNLVVMKFGGTSMGSAARMRVAAGILIGEKAKRPVVAVVSAMSKVTDLLLDTLRHAEAGDQPALESNLQRLQDRHVATCHELLPSEKRQTVLAGIHSLIADFQRIANGILMLGERPPRSVDEAVSIGERLSALLTAAYLESLGTRAVAVNAAEIIVTDSVFGNATPLMEPTREKARRDLLPWIEGGVLAVVTGFNGATADGRPTTLGRGGSDFSASILAAALDASELWIWTDVDGILTADPRLVPEAAVLDEVTYNEAAELAYNGAKVLHPRTLAPLIEKQIPVWSKNSFALDKPGTRIVSRISLPEASLGPRAVTSTASVVLVSLEPASPAINATQLMARAMDALARTNAEVLAMSSSSYRQSFCFLLRKEELPQALAALEAGLSLELAHGYVSPIEVDEDVGLLAVVGEGMRGTPGLAGRIFTAISRERINIIAIAQGSSELTIAIVVRREGLETAVKAVHAECHMGEAARERRRASESTSER
jgi:bifunctional aspartokinase / homoserine dehydrogenase 1